jgi:hypothetical protein
MQRHEGGYYIRLTVHDRTGVAAGVATRMAGEDISLESILQRRSEVAAHKDPHGKSGIPVPLGPHHLMRRPRARSAPRWTRSPRRALGRTAAGHPHRARIIIKGAETAMSQGITVQPGQAIERILTLELVRVTERAAVAAARLRGRGDEKAADQAAVDAMRRELNRLPIDGTVVIGEGERDEAPMLFIGERVGNRSGPKVDIAVDPLEGTTLCAKDMPGSIAVMAMAEAGTLLAAPRRLYAQDRGRPRLRQGRRRSRREPEENLTALAKAKGVKTNELTARSSTGRATRTSSRRVRKLGPRCG